MCYVFVYTGNWKEGNILFNDKSTFLFTVIWRRSDGKDHSDGQKGNLLLPPDGLLFFISSNGSFYMHNPKDRIHIPWPLIKTSCGALAGTKSSSVHPS